MRILHFSDIHLGLPPTGIAWLFDKRLLGTCTHFTRRKPHQDFSAVARLATQARALRPDIIVCTGDITAVARPEEFAAATDLLSPLREIPGADFIYIPGNHDAYIKGNAVTTARKTAIEQLNSIPRLKHLMPFQEILLDGLRLEILDTACPMPYWRSAGKAAPHALQELENAVNTPRLPNEARVLISHFPIFAPAGKRLSWRRRLDGDMTLRAFAQNRQLDLCLCGHIHTPFIHTAENGFIQSCAGALTLHHQATVIDINSATAAISAKQIDLSL